MKSIVTIIAALAAATVLVACGKAPEAETAPVVVAPAVTAPAPVVETPAVTAPAASEPASVPVKS